MKFLFLIGVEGTGHHMIRAILAHHLKQDEFVDEGQWHKLLTHYWDASRRLQLEIKLRKFIEAKELRDELKKIFQGYRNQNITHLFESASFPYEQPRDSLRRPDIIDFQDLVSDLIEIKYLIMYRNPISTTYSALRRNFTNNIHLQAKIVESNFIYIARQFSQLPGECYKILHFEEFLDDPIFYSKKLSDWWNLDQEILVKGLNNLRKPLNVSQIPAKERAILSNFFSQKRTNQWQSFYMNNKI